MKKKTTILLLVIILILLFCVVNYNLYVNQRNHEYNIYVVNATLPTLMITMDIVEERNTPTFLYYARESTIDKSQLEKYMPNITLSSYIGSYEAIQGNLYKEIQDYVKNVYKKDKKAHFNLIVDEYRGWLEFPIFTELGLNDEQYSVKYYSDGTLSYVANYEILKENRYDFFVEEKEQYLKTLEETRNNKNKCAKQCDYLINEKVKETEGLIDYPYDANYVLLATLRDNVEYYLQYPELIEFKDEKIAEEMKKANIKDINVKEKFNALDDNEKEIFFDLITFDKETFDKEYFNSKNNKYLIITGSNPFYGKYDSETFYRLIKNVINKYGNKYSILYKPHPAALPDEEQLLFFEQNKIKILPGKMPMEAITFVYGDLSLGGFPGSLYMGVESDKVLFFFEDSKEDLVSPLNDMYDELFKNVEIMN